MDELENITPIYWGLDDADISAPNYPSAST